jgi:hypothetical protein
MENVVHTNQTEMKANMSNKFVNALQWQRPDN